MCGKAWETLHTIILLRQTARLGAAETNQQQERIQKQAI